jgi:hypothetical protein
MIQVGDDFYFDTENILHHCQRLFTRLPFKNGYETRAFVCSVDNTSTHTKADLSLHDFRMKPGTRCPIDHIDYVDEFQQ